MDKSDGRRSIRNYLASDMEIYLEPIVEQQKIELAKWLLLGLAILFVIGGASLLFIDEKGQKFFDAVAAILPPIATLVIGYYFGEKNK